MRTGLNVCGKLQIWNRNDLLFIAEHVLQFAQWRRYTSFLQNLQYFFGPFHAPNRHAVTGLYLSEKEFAFDFLAIDKKVDVWYF